ncbi:ogr/Delta-like zinc finger family protein [Pantoea endophytica]
MAMKCPECSMTAHTRTSEYQTGTLKKTWYQCRNIDCSCTFTTLESLDTIIMKPQKAAEDVPEKESPPPRQTLNRYGSASRLSNRQNAPC